MAKLTLAEAPAEQLYKVRELATEWACSETQIRREVDSGRLGYVDIGRREKRAIRIPASEARAWIQARTIRARQSA